MKNIYIFHIIDRRNLRSDHWKGSKRLDEIFKNSRWCKVKNTSNWKSDKLDTMTIKTNNFTTFCKLNQKLYASVGLEYAILLKNRCIHVEQIKVI